MRALQRFFKPGELAERSNAAVLKTVSPQGLGGSNPSLSARIWPSDKGGYAVPMRALIAAAVLAVHAPALQAGCNDPPAAGVDWSRCAKQRLMLNRKDLQGARFEHAVLFGVNFDAADLSRASFASAEASRSSFRHTVLEGANLQKLVAVRSDFSGAKLVGADLEKAEFHRCVLTGAALRGVNLSKGDFGRSTFDRADLRGANLAQSNLARASFRAARLEGANFAHSFLFAARIEATDLSAVKGLVQEQIDHACGDAKTKLPPGLRAPASWQCAD